MSPPVLALVLTAAVAHAAWNFLAKGAEGGAAFVWLATMAGAAMYLPVLVLGLVIAPGHLGWVAVGLMAGSGVLHAVYFVLLQRGYAAGDLSLVYPLGRGTGALLAAVGATVLFGEHPSALTIVGGLTIVAAVFSLIARPGESLRWAGGPAAMYALATGVAIASYTLWDKHAVGPEALSPIVYLWGSNVVIGVLLTPWVTRHRARLRQAWVTSRRHAAGVGLLSLLAYVLILYALKHAPVSSVAPARESSILIGTLLGAVVLGEGDTRRRVIAAAATLVGITALALG
jgi:drug/metabolite transporter (DMT)-like permease